MYDTIVVGSDLSSLVAALLSSRYGKKTILLSEGDIPHFYSESDYTFNIDPFPWTGFGPKQVFLQLFSELEIPFIDKFTILQLNPALQIILPEHRIDLYSEKDSLLSEMEREFSGDVKKISDLYTVVSKNSELIDGLVKENPCIRPRTIKEFLRFLGNIPRLIGNRLVLLRNLKKFQDIPSLKRIFEAELLLLSNLYTGNIEPLSSAYITSLPLEGLFYHPGGKHILIDALREKFISYGGDFLENVSIMRLNMKNEIEIDIDEANNLSTIKGKNLIVSTKWEKLKLMLLNDKRFSRLARRFESIKPVYHPFTLHMGVFDKGIPEKIAEYVIVIGDEKRPVMDNNLTLLEVSSPGDTGHAPHGKRVISATVFLKESPLSLNDDDLKGVSAGILESLEGFLPFLRENIDFINIEKSIEISRKYQEVVNQKYEVNGNPLLGISTLPNRTPVKNVFITGGMLLAGLGFEGEVISGMNAASQVVGGTQNEQKNI
ncbi:MAG: hypothetical protein U9M96_03925 [Thermodesulfobacteriota bacterium]|nr:hypothetical protein [Thermodesulfobacteriota bacterium]